MGMYTEIYVNVDLKEDLPEEILGTLKAIVEHDAESPHLADKPHRWRLLFCSGSYYTPNTCCAKLTYSDATEQWSLIGKGDIKNYEDEIEAFFDWLRPHVEGDPDGTLIGYSRYEDQIEPTLYYTARDPD